MRLLLTVLALTPVAVHGGDGGASPGSVRTAFLGPFAGPGAPLHADNRSPHRIRFYGTDLGFTYEHDGRLQILFGDTMATEFGDRIEASSGDRLDDGFGSIDLHEWSDPASFAPGHIPPIRLGQNPGTVEMSAIDPGHAMEGFKTPVGGFSNGSEEFGLFYLGKPQGCRTDKDCGDGLSCDTGLGYFGAAFDTDEGLTLGCVDGSGAACIAQTIDGEQPSGLCGDLSSTIWSGTDRGRIAAVAVKIRFAVRDAGDPRHYSPVRDWLTNKFQNPAIRRVNDFVPDRGPGRARQDYRPEGPATENRRLFIWGRPAFVGVNARDRTAGLYFAYVDLPVGPAFDWVVRYYTGTSADGIPQFSPVGNDAAALDLDASRAGIQATEPYDIVDQQSVAWVEQLRKWVMFYGGGLSNLPYPAVLPTCGVLELFVGAECTDVDMGNGAIRMRTADDPWGPWSPPQDVIIGGDPAVPDSGLYGEGGLLRHPACTSERCAPHTRARDIHPDEYGFLYSANIIEEWIRPAGKGVDVIWNASTWDPYRVILLRTRIEPR